MRVLGTRPRIAEHDGDIRSQPCQYRCRLPLSVMERSICCANVAPDAVSKVGILYK